MSLDSTEWRHYLRLSFVAGGAERLRAAQRVLALRSGLAIGHWLAATVYVARSAFDAALDHLRAGCAVHDASRLQPEGVAEGFTAVGLHLLHGLVLAARGDVDAAQTEFARELATAHPGHVYAREACGNACYAAGALHLRGGDKARARLAFIDALERVPSHPLAALALAICREANHTARNGRSESPRDAEHASSENAAFDVAAAGTLGAVQTDGHAIACAVAHALHGRHDEAARLCEGALACRRADPGAMWILPVEPLLNVAAYPGVWERALALLRQRAS